VLAICVEGVLLLAQSRLDDSRAAAQRGDQPAALSAALDARSIQPWAASPYLQLALLQEQSGNLRAADRRIREAIERDASDWRLHLVAARIAVKRGFIGKAKRDLDRARALNPRSPLFAR
jgi:Tfp pilus assembly protein PilF